MQEVELKSGGDTGYKLTGGTKQGLYGQLLPIQTDIMNVLLSDLDTGKELMGRYKALVSEFDKCEEISMDLMKKMVDLENDVKDAKKNASKVKVESYANKCDELLLRLNKDTIEQTQRSLESLRESFRKRSGDFTLEEVNQIGNMLGSIRFYIIREKRKANPNLDLQGEISEEEIKQLESTFSYEAIKLLNSEKPREQFVGKQIRADLALLGSDENSVVYDGAIWDKFASVSMLPQDKGLIAETTQLANKSSSLALVTKKNSIWDKIRNTFKNLRANCGRKTEIEKIADEFVTQEMLDQYINFSKPEGERYIPDKRLPVYDFLKKMQEEKKKIYNGKELTWNFIDKAGKEFEVKIIQSGGGKIDYHYTNIVLTSIQGENSINKKATYHFAETPITIMQFAKFLGIEEQMKQMMGNYYKNIHTDGSESISTFLGKDKTYKELIKRLNKAMAEYSETQFEFYATENARKQNAQSEMPKRRSFKEQLRTLDTSKALEDTGFEQQTSEQSIEGEKPKEEGTQLGG